jgi:hypothetical protein
VKKVIARNLFILSFGAAGALLGIQGCKCEIQCSKAMINIGYVGYDSLSLDTVIIRRFDKTSSGNKLKDTILLAAPEHIRYRIKGDTAMWGGSSNLGMFPFYSLQSDWNYEVFIPSTGKTFKISDIMEEQTRENLPCNTHMVKMTCMNAIYSITVDNRSASMDDYYNIFLSK